MTSRRATFVLMGLNVALVTAVAYIVLTMRSTPTVVAAPGHTNVVTNTVTQIAVRKINSTNLLGALAGRPVSWRSLESTNYVVYIDNLRNFGCPEETIRDLIITDVAKLYARRRAEVRTQVQPYRFWQTADPLTGMPNTSPELQRELRELDKEQRELIRQLLGVELQAEMAKYYDDQQAADESFAFLPEEKQSAVKALAARYSEMEEEIYAGSRGLLLEEDQERLRELQRQRKAELAALLTPQEMEEYDLRHSDTANNMRSQLAGFQATEEEFRNIYRLQRVVDESLENGVDGQQAQEALNAEILKVLGPQRYAEYERAQDTDYRALLQVGERYQLAPAVAQQVYNLKQAVEAYKMQLETNPNYTPEQRSRLAALLASDTQQYLAATMGPEVLATYTENGGQWVDGLSAVEEPRVPVEQTPAAAASGTVLPYDINLLPPSIQAYLNNPFPPQFMNPPRRP